MNKKNENNEHMRRASDIEKLGKASVLDLGSNSIKLVNYRINSYNDYKPYHQESVRLKLSEGLENGVLREDYVDNTIETLKLFRNIVDFEQVNYVISVATSAIRDAENRYEILDRIRKETNFDFKILSEHDEALYSYTGAIRSLRIPNAVFFDIGGGSLEIVYAENFVIKKVLSIPLGALRLTQMFSDSKYAITDFYKMEKHVTNLLPTLKDLGIPDSSNLVLVGVGGVLRTLAKYDQQLRNYPLSKLHNYKVTRNSLESIFKRIQSLPIEKLSKIQAIGSSRADTVRTGVLVITRLMKILRFDELTISAHGLREGTLALSLQYPNEFANQNIDYDKVKEIIYLSAQMESLSEYVEDFVRLMYSMNLLADHERELLSHTISQIDKLWSFRDVDNVMYSILDDDSPLSHREQLIVALALIYSKKKKKVDSLILKFENILEIYDKKLIKKISSIVSLCDIFHKTGVKIKATSDGPKSINLVIYAKSNIFPEVLLHQTCERLENTLNISIKTNIYYQTSLPSSGSIGIT